MWNQLEIASVIDCAVMASLNYIVQLTVVRFSILNQVTDGLAMFVMGNPHCVFWAPASAYARMNLAMLFAAPVFEGEKLGRCIRWLFHAFVPPPGHSHAESERHWTALVTPSLGSLQRSNRVADPPQSHGLV